jgi:hypothetical protein
MSVRSRRLAVAGVIAAAMIAVPAAALASGSGTPPGKPPPSAAASESAAASKSAARQSGALGRVTERAMVSALATQLGVSHGAAQRAFSRLDALSGPGGVDPASPAFAAIAHDLGVSATRLAAALDGAKQAARQAAETSGAGE